MTDPRIWLARLSEGWCPRPEHGRLTGDLPNWCPHCCARWTIRDGAPNAQMEHPNTLDHLDGSVRERVLTEDTAVALLAELDTHGQTQHEAMMSRIQMPSFATLRPFRMERP